MLRHVAAVCFAAFLIVWPVRSGLDSGTLDAFSPEAMLSPGPDQDDDAPMHMVAFDAAEPQSTSTLAEPFGLAATTVASGDFVTKWHNVEAAIRADALILAHCRIDAADCPAAAKSFLAIVAQGSALTGRSRIGLINRAVNLAIEPMSDMAQWGVPDRWSAPLETFTTHRGDCEDYAIAKYVALTAAGMPADDVKLVVVRNLAANEDHAVVAVRDENRWLILDNRWLTMVDDIEMPKAIPLFVLDDTGVRQYEPATATVPNRSAAPASLGF